MIFLLPAHGKRLDKLCQFLNQLLESGELEQIESQKAERHHHRVFVEYSFDPFQFAPFGCYEMMEVQFGMHQDVV